MEKNYRPTIYACFVGYVVQAIVNNFAPLLFLTFQRRYGIPLERITLLVSLNFGVQLLVDLLSVKWVDRLGYRASMVLAHGAAALGLILLAVLPGLLPDPYWGLLVAVVCYALGGGLLEVTVSPVMEACPTENKAGAMSLLHSFYCWGHMAVVLLSTGFFALFGVENWPILALLWALVPLGNLFAFTRVPIAGLLPEGQREMGLPALLKSGLFWTLFLLMLCAGACEQAVSQWASLFAEEALGVAKTVGDLAGPMFFAGMMGLSRAIYGKLGDRLPLEKSITVCGALCLGAYLLIAGSPLPALGLLGCGLCGFSVGILWPGTFSMAARALPAGGTALFALLALAGDLGCSGGPTYVGFLSGSLGLRAGIAWGCVFPVLLLIGLWVKRKLSTPGPK